MIEVNNLTRFKIDEKSFTRLSEKVLMGEKKERTELSVSLVIPLEIKKFNKKYRKIDRETDVLSFAYNDFGEILICPKVVKENAEKYGESFKRELKKVLIHGLLHIFGYDHGKNDSEAKKMEKKTNYYLNLDIK